MAYRQDIRETWATYLYTVYAPLLETLEDILETPELGLSTEAVEWQLDR